MTPKQMTLFLQMVIEAVHIREQENETDQATAKLVLEEVLKSLWNSKADVILENLTNPVIQLSMDDRSQSIEHLRIGELMLKQLGHQLLDFGTDADVGAAYNLSHVHEVIVATMQLFNMLRIGQHEHVRQPTPTEFAGALKVIEHYKNLL